jgi:hypothetical protein
VLYLGMNEMREFLSFCTSFSGRPRPSEAGLQPAHVACSLLTWPGQALCDLLEPLSWRKTKQSNLVKVVPSRAAESVLFRVPGQTEPLSTAWTFIDGGVSFQFLPSDGEVSFPFSSPTVLGVGVTRSDGPSTLANRQPGPPASHSLSDGSSLKPARAARDRTSILVRTAKPHNCDGQRPVR